MSLSSLSFLMISIPLIGWKLNFWYYGGVYVAANEKIEDQRSHDGKKKAILLVGLIYKGRLRANLWEDTRDNFGERVTLVTREELVRVTQESWMANDRQLHPRRGDIADRGGEEGNPDDIKRTHGRKQLGGKTVQACLLTDEEGWAAAMGLGCSRCSIRVTGPAF